MASRCIAYRFDKRPRVAASASLFDSAEVTGDVTIGEDTIIGAGVKIIGDSHGPVRNGNRVQILEQQDDQHQREICIEGAVAAGQPARLLEIADKTPVTRLFIEGISISTELVLP